MMKTERDLADCVGAVYEAATYGGDWASFGTRICRLFDAHSATFRIGDGSGTKRNVLMAVDDSEAAYVTYFHNVNPYMPRAHRDFDANRQQSLGRVKLGAEIMPDASFLASEYYQDFGRFHGRRHMIGGMIGIETATPLALFRADEATPFGERDAMLLGALLPHLQRALELRSRLALDQRSSGLTRALLDTLPFGVAVVDAGLKLRFANDVAQRYLARPDAGLLSMRSGPFTGSGSYLAAVARQDAATLRQFAISATAGGTGGWMRVASGDGTSMAVLVSPAPQLLAEEIGGMVIGGSETGSRSEALALIVIRPLERKACPSVAMLCDLFSFSRAEAEVAIALSGGASAAEVADQRGVSLVTVRNQIRSILGKSECANLRDFERAIATVATLVPGSV